MADKNRWLIALSAIAIHLSIGSIYAYSVYQNPLNEALGWETTDVSLAFTIAIFILGLSAAFFGKFVERKGPRISAIIAAILFGIGTVGAGFAVAMGSYIMFLLFFGVIGGFGLGFGYIAPVSTLVKWFPDRRGLATGMAVMGFGAGALVTSPIANMLMSALSIPMTFYILGISYFLLMLLGGLYIAKPPEGWTPHGKEVEEEEDKGGDLAYLKANEAAKTLRFWLLWGMMFINISAGIMLLSVASPMAQDITGATAATAASVVGIMGLFNGGGRIIWASASDYIGRANTYLIFFIFQVAAFFLLPYITNVILFSIILFLIISCYGGGFSCLPAFIGDLFGTKQLGAIHGYLLTSWSLAGVVGPMIVSAVYENTGSYVFTFFVFAFLLLAALVLAILMKRNIAKIREENNNTEKEKGGEPELSPQ
ncbi:MFS transporter, OFA family, oxalate/formate antiporter [Alteribacillus persepolensis]|uniref:MFS transporter, OFA family, oxalate/formate antiporter n=1 Tax=Alteribacillus persepolensis TaxID=568899 RepID=A0A1G8DTV0_9BACI|nr:OFA family MFS transporter [Alteribacillus persepolensis]SDH61028.1 MFS transporter, OFA family, oxalate/formate antiporter [Alteribacillus persepolensis]